MILDHKLDTEVILDHIEMDTEVIKLIHVVKSYFILKMIMKS